MHSRIFENEKDRPYFPEWVKDAVFYQIFPDRFYNGDCTNDPPYISRWGEIPKRNSFFGGDFKGVLQKLSYLKELGINAIWFNPVFEASSNHKYNTKDYLKIDPHLGSIGDFKKMLQGCHSNQIRVILDGVFNHTGKEFFAFQDIKRRGLLQSIATGIMCMSLMRMAHPLSMNAGGALRVFLSLTWIILKFASICLTLLPVGQGKKGLTDGDWMYRMKSDMSFGVKSGNW